MKYLINSNFCTKHQLESLCYIQNSIFRPKFLLTSRVKSNCITSLNQYTASMQLTTDKNVETSTIMYFNHLIPSVTDSLSDAKSKNISILIYLWANNEMQMTCRNQSVHTKMGDAIGAKYIILDTKKIFAFCKTITT